MGHRLPQHKVPELAFLIALIPLFAFTSENAFLFITPCIIYLIYHYQKFSTAGKASLVLACLLIGANVRDLAGATLHDYLHGLSVYSFGTVLLLILLFVLRYKRKKFLTDKYSPKEEVLSA